MKRKILIALINILVLCGCSSSHKIKTKNDSSYWDKRKVTKPKEHVDIIDTLLADKAKDKELNDYRRKIIKTLILDELKNYERLSKNGEITLIPGKPYRFDLKSFCVEGGAERGLKGDGAYPAELDAKSIKWLSVILNNFEKSGIKQSRAQTLIWGVMSGTKFDDFSLKNQEALLKLFPDARIRFGSSIIKEMLKDEIERALSTNKYFEEVSDLLQKFRDKQDDFERLQRTFAPLTNRKTVLPSDWFQTDNTGIVNLESHGGFSKVIANIYVNRNSPENLKFRPSEMIFYPTKGQRLALSPYLASSREKYLKNIREKYLKDEVTEKEASLIIQDPYAAFQMYRSMKDAYQLTAKKFPGMLARNNKVDAFRHFVWSGISTARLGKERAKKFLDAHEEKPGQPKIEREMDLYNNNQGMIAGDKLRGKKNLLKLISQKALEAIKNNELRIIIK